MSICIHNNRKYTVLVTMWLVLIHRYSRPTFTQYRVLNPGIKISPLQVQVLVGCCCIMNYLWWHFNLTEWKLFCKPAATATTLIIWRISLHVYFYSDMHHAPVSATIKCTLLYVASVPIHYICSFFAVTCCNSITTWYYITYATPTVTCQMYFYTLSFISIVYGIKE